MVSNLINKHKLIAAKINQATADDDLTLIRKLDREYSSVWQELLSAQPETDEEKSLLVQYLLEHIPDLDEGMSEAREISEKILSLM